MDVKQIDSPKDSATNADPNVQPPDPDVQPPGQEQRRGTWTISASDDQPSSVEANDFADRKPAKEKDLVAGEDLFAEMRQLRLDLAKVLDISLCLFRIHVPRVQYSLESCDSTVLKCCLD
jgi:hypothetical protein